MIYVDVAASAKYGEHDNIVVASIVDAMKEYWQNPSSLHASNVRNKIDKCRKNIAKFVGANASEIYFTSGASESNNWAIRGWVDEMLVNASEMINVVTTPIEHKSILEAVSNNSNLGAYVGIVSIDEYGLIDYNSLNRMLWLREKEPILVSVNMANNEIGTIQEIKMISDLVHSYNGVLHVDATQAFGHIPINVEELGIDMMSVSGHKISPVLKGVGFLYKKECINIHPLIYGSQEGGLRGGTENTFGIIGLDKAIEYCNIREEKIDELCIKRDHFINILKYKFGCKLNGHEEYRLPNNISVTFPQNITGEALLHTLDMSNIKIGTGSACNSHSIESSHVLKAIGLSDEEAMRTIRISLPDDITYQEIDCIIEEIDKSIKIIEV